MARHKPEGLKLREAAEVLDMRLGTAKSRLAAFVMPRGFASRVEGGAGMGCGETNERAGRPVGRGTKLGLVVAVLAMALVGWLALHRVEKQGALAQALEELRNAETIHFVARSGEAEADGKTIEFWIRDETHFRQEETKDGKLSWVCVQQGDVQRTYTAWSNTYYLTKGQIGTGLHDFGQLLLYPDVLLPSLVKHYRDPEGTGHVERPARDEDGRPMVRHTLQTGERDRLIYAAEAKTGRILALEGESLDRGTWRRALWFDQIEYNVPIPDEVFVLEPPEGATVLEDAWWETRKHQVLAEAGAEQGVVLQVHAVDLRDNGDVVVSLSEHQPMAPDGGHPPYTMYGRLVDDEGRGYAQLPSMGYEPDSIVADADGQPRSRSAVYHTLTFTPVEGRGDTKPVSFDIELPPLPGAEDDGLVLFTGVEANQLPPGDPFQRVVSGDPPPDARTEEQIAVERLEAIDRYRQSYTNP